MDTFVKLTSTKPNKNCNCITPFYIADINGINPNTSAEFTDDDKDVIKSTLYRISNSRGCNVGICCDPNDPFNSIDQDFMNKFKKTYPKIMPIYNGTTLDNIKLSTVSNVKQSGYIEPTPYFVCKITKATIKPTNDPSIFIATNLVQDCFDDSCTDAEKITLQNLITGSKTQMLEYTAVDDEAVASAIKDGNIDGVKRFIRKYKTLDAPLTFDDYNNRMLHIAAMSKSKRTMEIVDLLLALKANVNVKNKNNETPLHLAILSGNINVIDRLINVGADLTVATISDETPIFYAIKSNNLGILRMLYTGGSSILAVDNKGNNLIQYCLISTPKPDRSTVQIVKFLLDNGVAPDSTNNANKTALQIVAEQIDKIVNIHKVQIEEEFSNQVKEAFFNVSPPFTAKQIVGAQKQDVNKDEEIALLEIQTMLFNNILRNNPSKYSGYINVADIPAGSPIDVLDTVCVGGNNTGNEDSNTCVANGGQIVKIDKPTTLIKLELLPEEQSAINSIKQNDLYYKKIGEKKPLNTIPSNISTYNKMAMQAKPTNANITVEPTQGLVYQLGQSSENVLSKIENVFDLSKKNTTDTTTNKNEIVEAMSNQNEIIMPPTHPNITKMQIIESKRQALINSYNLGSTEKDIVNTIINFINSNMIIIGPLFGAIILILIIRVILLIRK